MYLDFFGLKEYPFRLTPDTEFLYMSEAHARAKAYMDYTVFNRDGFVVITGEIGCGKTTLIQKLLSELDPDAVLVAKVFQTQLDEVEFLQAVLVEFGLNPFGAKKVELIDMLNNFMIEQLALNRQLVLIVDDAQNLGVKVFEEIRMLSGLETNKEKLLHVILVGHPQLDEVLDAPELEQLMQRVRLRYQIKPLSESDTRGYVRHRLQVAGANGDIFDPDVFPLIVKYTGGVPRLINTLCDTCLVCAFADGLHRVSTAVFSAAVEELQWEPYAKRHGTQRSRRTDSGARPDALMQREQLRRLAAIESKLGALDALVPTLDALSRRVGDITQVLETLTETLARDSQGGGGVTARRLRAGK